MRSAIALLLFFVCTFCPTSPASAAENVNNLRWYHVDDARVIIWYDLGGNTPSDVTFEVVPADGAPPFIPTSLTGDAGPGIQPGPDRRAVWTLTPDESARITAFSIRSPSTGVPTSGVPAEDGAISADDMLHPLFIDTPVNLDGILDEPFWAQSIPVTEFRQWVPMSGTLSSERTEARVVYDKTGIYIAMMCYDSEPDNIISRVRGLDNSLSGDDYCTFVIDTYHDAQSGYYLSVNSAGARFDGSLDGNSGMSNAAWDGMWEATAKVSDIGWAFEAFIPFKTLRFPDTDIQTWGINFRRLIRRKNEIVLWKSYGRNDDIRHLAKAGALTFPTVTASGRQLDAKPFIVGGMEKVRGLKGDDTFKYGLDVRYGITSNATIDFTTKTDFAQVESDQEQINLTRFNLFYPEKRDFFIEGSDYFNFTQGGTRLFYSRRIGLSESREAVPIIGGTKFTQKAGKFRIGVMTMQTEDTKEQPTTNYSVVRVKKDMLDQSYIGLIATSIADGEYHDNQVYGLDTVLKTSHFLGDKNFEVQGYVAGSVDDGKGRDSLSGRVFINYPNDLIKASTLYHVIGNQFTPEMGFVSRTGIRNFIWSLQLNPRAKAKSIRRFTFGLGDLNYTTDMNNVLLSRSLTFQPFGIYTEAGDSFNYEYGNAYDYVEDDFTIFEDVIVPTGRYSWWSHEASASTGPGRMWSGRTSVSWGEYYNGTRGRYSVDCTLTPSSVYSVSSDVEFNDIRIGNRSFETREYGGRFALHLGNRFSTSIFSQYNNDTREVNSNIRLRFTPKTGSDVHIVYNTIMDERDEYTTLRSTALLKMDYTYRF